MTHFAFLAPPYAGHLNPMLALANGLMGRGHRVTFVAQDDVGPLVRAGGIGFAAVGVDTHPPGTRDRMSRRLASTTGLFGVGAVIRDMARTTDMLCDAGPSALQAIGAEAIIVDQTEPAGGLLARHLGLPQVSVANALLINRDPLVPPPFVGWGFDDTAWGVERNRGGYRVADWMMRPLFDVIRRRSEAWRLGPVVTLDHCLSPVLQVSQTVESLDFPRRERPPGLVHVGPLRLGEHEPWAADDGRPLVFCSFGTLQGARFGLFRAVAEACWRLDLALVIAHGGRLSEAEAGALPGRARVEAFVPQRAVIRRAAAVVTHGGLNTVLDALAAGVPVVVLPIAFEQAAIAARVVRCGVGLTIPSRQATPTRVAAGLRELLFAGRYRERAGALAQEISRAGGVVRAVDLIEEAMRNAASGAVRRARA